MPVCTSLLLLRLDHLSLFYILTLLISAGRSGLLDVLDVYCFKCTRPKKKKNPYWHVWYQPLYHIWASSDHSAWTQAGQPMNPCTVLVCTYCMALTLCVTPVRRDGRQVLAAGIATSLLIYNRTFTAVYHIMYPSEQLCLNVHPCCQTCHFATEPDNAASS